MGKHGSRQHSGSHFESSSRPIDLGRSASAVRASNSGVGGGNACTNGSISRENLEILSEGPRSPSKNPPLAASVIRYRVSWMRDDSSASRGKAKGWRGQMRAWHAWKGGASL
jgi:hypothetical protein